MLIRMLHLSVCDVWMGGHHGALDTAINLCASALATGTDNGFFDGIATK